MRPRSQLIPWRTAGRLTEGPIDADRVVQTTGWVFNSETGESLTLAEFVATGDREVPVYLQTFGLEDPADGDRRLAEIGSGIGRMTCALTRRYGTVYACDVDGGFLERCREAVARFGQVDRLRTVEVADGRTLPLADDTVDIAFSYITLQHCERDDALALACEAARITRPGGRVALHFRSWSAADPVVLPVGAVTRAAFRIPRLGPWLSQQRLPARLAWQANRLDPHQVLAAMGQRIDGVTIWRHPSRTTPPWGVDGVRVDHFEGINRNHWWLVATVV